MTTIYASHLTASEYRDEREGEYGELTPEEFPNMFRVMTEAQGLGDWDADFEAGLSALIAGLVTNRIA